MVGSLRRVIIGACLFGLTLIVATVGYMIAGWSFIDSAYMVVITIFGVGYGEVRPITSSALRVFTIFVIIGGAFSAAYIVGGFIQLVTEGEINRALIARRVSKGIERMEQHVIICGFGRIGQILAKQMADTEQTFVIIDVDPELTAKAETMGYMIRTGNATDESVLISAGIEKAKVLATVLSDDAANVFITLTARGLNSSISIVARGEYPSTEKKLRLAGADHVVLPATIGAMRMAHLVTQPAATEFLDSSNDGRSDLNELLGQLHVQLDEMEIVPDSPLIGKTIGDVEVRGKGAFILVALRRVDGEVITSPAPSIYLRSGDTIIAIGHRGDIPKFAKQFALKRQIRYRGAST